MSAVAGTPHSAQLRTYLIVLAVIGALALAIYAVQALFMLLAGVVCGVLLDGLSGGLSRWTRLPRGWSLCVVVLLFLIAVAGLVWLVVPTLVEQLADLADRVPELVRELRRRSPGDDALPSLETLARPAWRVGTGTMQGLGAALVIGFLGIYLAARPDEYVSGFVRLFPPPRRERAREVLARSAHQLRRWALAAGLAMLSAGVLTGLGLWALDARYALALGLVAGLAEFVPNFGPLAAMGLAVLLAWIEGHGPDWWKVLLLFVVLQTFQSYVVQPLTQRRLTDVPPALGIGTIVLLGWVSGPLGVLMGIPLLLVARVLIELLWWRDRLGEPIELPGE